MNSKKGYLILARLILILIALVALCDLIFIENVEIIGYDHQHYGEAVVTPGEAAVLMLLYHLSPNAGQIDAEPCCAAYAFQVHYRFGTIIYVGEGCRNKMIKDVDLPGNLPSPNRHYVYNPLLISYLQKLIVKYDLPVDF